MGVRPRKVPTFGPFFSPCEFFSVRMGCSLSKSPRKTSSSKISQQHSPPDVVPPNYHSTMSASSPPASFTLRTELGDISLRFRHDAAPKTCQYYIHAFQHGLFNSGHANFYRSDFVIQCGLHGSSLTHPSGDLPANETAQNVFVTNGPGTAAVAHWDVPDCGNTEFFINLGENKHLDSAYGGYCVFAEVRPKTEDPGSWRVVESIRDRIKQQGGMVRIDGVVMG